MYWLNVIYYPLSILIYALSIKYVNNNNYKDFDEITTRAFSFPSGWMLGGGTFCLVKYKIELSKKHPQFYNYFVWSYILRIWWIPATCFVICCLVSLLSCRCLRF